MYIIINELEKDVLREIISIGLARAADSFSSFAKGGVLLDVPDIKII
jgi:chemotaxis protein CheC